MQASGEHKVAVCECRGEEGIKNVASLNDGTLEEASNCEGGTLGNERGSRKCNDECQVPRVRLSTAQTSHTCHAWSIDDGAGAGVHELLGSSLKTGAYGTLRILASNGTRKPVLKEVSVLIMING